jgi:apolipoprotein N-acyltransferase
MDLDGMNIDTSTLPWIGRGARSGLLLAIAASAALGYLGTGLHPIWWLTWFASLPLLLIAPRVPAGQAAAASALAWLLAASNIWRYLHGVVGVPVVVIVLATVLPACVFGALVFLYRSLIRRQRPWLATLSVPALWVSYEYVYSIVSPHGTFGLIGYSQMDWLPIVQIASVTGIWGIAFCLFLFSSALATWFNTRGGRRAIGPPAAVSLFLVAVLAFGWWRLAAPQPPGGHPVSVALLASDAPAHGFPETDEASLALFRQYADRVGALAERLDREMAQGADRAIVLPEKIGELSDAAIVQMDDMFRLAAARAAATVVVGVDLGTATARRNEARVYRPAGMSPAVYDKQHLIPGLEAVDEAGTTMTLVRGLAGTAGIQICKDMDFPALSRRYARERIALLVVPAWDFDVDGWLHGRMAVLRGVEGGFAIARSAKQGRLTLSDNRGRIVAEQASDATPFSTIVAGARVAHEDTIYARFGDWFAWFNVAILIGVLVYTRGAHE